MTTTTAPGKVITPITHRDNGYVETEFMAEYDGQLIGYYSTNHHAEVALDGYVLHLCEQGLIDPPDGPPTIDTEAPDPLPPLPSMCDDEANRTAALFLLARGIDACTVCGGAHRPTKCPEVSEVYHADLPNPGRAIARHWHMHPKSFLNVLRQLDPVIWWVLAEAYAAYRRQSVQQVLDNWMMAVQGTSDLGKAHDAVQTIIQSADAAAETYTTV